MICPFCYQVHLLPLRVRDQKFDKGESFYDLTCRRSDHVYVERYFPGDEITLAIYKMTYNDWTLKVFTPRSMAHRSEIRNPEGQDAVILEASIQIPSKEEFIPLLKKYMNYV